MSKCFGLECNALHLLRSLMRSVLVQQKTITQPYEVLIVTETGKKRYFHNILDAVKCPQAIWSIHCDHLNSLHWDLVRGWEGQPLAKKPCECFPCCLLDPKIILQVQLSWHCFSGKVSSKTSPFNRQSEALLSQYSSVWVCRTVLLDHQIDVQWMLRRWIGFFWAYFAL